MNCTQLFKRLFCERRADGSEFLALAEKFLFFRS